MASTSTGKPDPLINFRRISIAPMMAVTDRHFRYLMRLITPSSLLYSEMITTGALLHGDPAQLLRFHPFEKPLACQLGGNDPQDLAACARIAEALGYDEINLNVGCPSPRVKSGGFGACLMLEPERVADCIAAMHQAVRIPVTIKTRIGVDLQDSYAHFAQFIEKIAQSAPNAYIIHARKAWLSGINAKKNRQIPPLRYDDVYRVAREHADMTFIINGGIASVDDVRTHLAQVAGVMIGREAERDPFLLARIEREILNPTREVPSARKVLDQYRCYMSHEMTTGARIRELLKPLYGLLMGMKQARYWRGQLTELASAKNFSITQIDHTLGDLQQVLC